VLHPVLNSTPYPAPGGSTPLLPRHHEAGRRWTTGELTEIVAALAALRTSDIANIMGVNPKALRSALRRNGISLRALREQAAKGELTQGIGVVVRRSTAGPSAVYAADALVQLDDSACRWPVGDPAKPGFHFCGAQRSGHRSYCRKHLSQASEREGVNGH
jgi:GcrA cell cycle regulator